MALTTIKVPVKLRERISTIAKAMGVTSAGLIAEALDQFERQQRWESVRQAYTALPADDDYWDETRSWDATLSDGLPDE